ncbi:Leucine-rich repeat (LRR) family protein, putative isoform 1 [Hibiscus syriacus]|uniref:Leucine-rich repeat (LRR) family protein, putative isoform 1 n=1 Tax=Hibiscus syriacus TaxID=106335 RepID=A0A6A2XK10_HIBSY|nr:Leucine-rich repeat (LRR) family protein, putative isoform 1 [Hibiscus syriacus]
MEYKAMLRTQGQGNMAQTVPKITQVAGFNGDEFISFKDFVGVHKKSDEDGHLEHLECKKMEGEVNTDNMVDMDEFMNMMNY